MIIDEIGSPTLSVKIEAMLEWLASFGKGEHQGVTRLLYSREWLAAQQAVKQHIEEIGLHAYYDDVGNVFGRLQGVEKNTPAIVTGSHIDTVISGGKYDGAYGILAGLIAVEYLYTRYGQPKKTIEVVSLCEEEGSRFPLTYWGSGSITGLRSYSHVEHLQDAAGCSFVEAMQQVGFGMGTYKAPRRDDISCFIELHIEQGERLEREDKAIGIVSHIVGQRRYYVTVTGESNHAGTTPMGWRRDAMHTAAELIQTLMQKATETSPELVATVGQITLKPNISNVIPNKAIFSVDIRHSDEQLLSHFCEDIFRVFAIIARKHETELSVENWMNEKPVKMCDELSQTVEEIVEADTISFTKMTSGAGHDSQVFGQFCPTALLFVPSHKGMSHSPQEFTSVDDLEKGVQLLIKLLYRLAY